MKIDVNDIVGKRFEKLTVIKLANKIQKYNSKGCKDGLKYIYLCSCDCGNTCFVERNHLITLHTKSCGCYKIGMHTNRLTKHNKRYTKIYNVWSGIKRRCYNPHQKSYKNYGGRGIIMCDEWLKNFQTFYNWAINNGYEEGLTIDRINNNGNYEPSNCRWVRSQDQTKNLRTNHYITYNNETHCLSKWAEIYNIPKNVMYTRVSLGWDFEKIISTPPKTNKKSKLYEYQGIYKTLNEWCKFLNIEPSTFYKRLKKYSSPIVEY